MVEDNTEVTLKIVEMWTLRSLDNGRHSSNGSSWPKLKRSRSPSPPRPRKRRTAAEAWQSRRTKEELDDIDRFKTQMNIPLDHATITML